MLSLIRNLAGPRVNLDKQLRQGLLSKTRKIVMTPFVIGNSPRRLEDERFLRGEGRYVDDVALPGMVYASFVRSPHAHAMILRVNSRVARTMPDVLAVLTHDELLHDNLAPLHPSVRCNAHTAEAFNYLVGK